MGNLKTKDLFERFDIEQMDAQSIQVYVDTLVKFNKSIKLTSFTETWLVDHLEDSIRSYFIFKDLNSAMFIDCGSGNGLPGIIFAILSKKPFILCDVDQRKCEFLRILVHRLKLSGNVFPESLLALDIDQPLLDKSVFIYRGLGPDSILLEAFNKFNRSIHFRFKSGRQNQIFPGSIIKEYHLSDKSMRQIELSVPRRTK